MALAFGGAASAAPTPLPVSVSGYELLLGSPCTINTQSGTCDVTFSGWTGGGGQMANGWTRVPGTGQGLWEATVNYTGRTQSCGGSREIMQSGLPHFVWVWLKLCGRYTIVWKHPCA